MVRAVDEAEHPVEDTKLNAEATSLVPRERPPQQTAEVSHLILAITIEVIVCILSPFTVASPKTHLGVKCNSPTRPSANAVC